MGKRVQQILFICLVIIVTFPNFISSYKSHKNDEWNRENVKQIIGFIENVCDSFQWKEFFLFSDWIQGTKFHAWLLKRFSAVRIHLIQLPVKDIRNEMQIDVTSHYHKAIVWSRKQTMDVFIQQALDELVFKSAIRWIFIGPEVESAFHPLESDYGEQTFIANVNSSAISIYLLNGNIYTDAQKQYVGRWSPTQGLTWHRTIDGSTPIFPKLHGNLVQVAVREEIPFFYYKRDKYGRIIGSGGMIHDLLELVKQVMKWRFNITAPIENNSGSMNDTAHWDGLIGLLQRNEVDIVAADISLTEDRLSVAEFSTPFMMASLGIAVKLTSARHSDYHLLPFSCGIWIMVLVSLLLTAILLTAACSWSPSGQSIVKYFQKDFSLGGCLFIIFSLMSHQGSETIPKPISAKVIFIVHCMFAFLMLESYASVLTASLSTNLIHAPFSKLEELIDNSDYNFGIRQGSSNVEYLKTSNARVLQKAWKRIESNPENFCLSTELGIAKAKNEKFAYIDNFSTLKYHLSSNCNFKVLKEGVDMRGYHFAFPKNSPYQQRISTLFRQLTNSGILQVLKQRHFKTSDNCEERKTTEENNVRLEHIFGLILFLVGSYSASVLIMLTEAFIWRNSEKIPVKFFKNVFATFSAAQKVKVVKFKT